MSRLERIDLSMLVEKYSPLQLTDFQDEILSDSSILLAWDCALYVYQKKLFCFIVDDVMKMNKTSSQSEKISGQEYGNRLGRWCWISKFVSSPHMLQDWHQTDGIFYLHLLQFYLLVLSFKWQLDWASAGYYLWIGFCLFVNCVPKRSMETNKMVVNCSIWRVVQNKSRL